MYINVVQVLFFPDSTTILPRNRNNNSNIKNLIFILELFLVYPIEAHSNNHWKLLNSKNRLDCNWKWQKLSLYQIGSSYRIFIKLYKLNSETQNMASKSKMNNLIFVNICFHIFIAIMVLLALNTNENLEMRIFNVIMIVLPVVGSAIYLSKRLG